MPRLSIPLSVFSALLFICLASPPPPAARADDDMRYRILRENMVRDQIVNRGVSRADVLRAMSAVPRHRFVPPGQQKYAYEDRPLPIGRGQTISQPYIVALMSAVLEPGPTKRILEVGTGSGYQAAILAEICRAVYSIEIIDDLGRRADQTLRQLGYDNVHVRIGDGYKGWPEAAPFDGIIVTCSPSEVPRPLTDQLAEGGIMVIPVGTRFAQELVLLKKINGRVLEKTIIPVRFVPMVNPDGSRY
jgi:protein-L-isoaspartate(D-aspartate) O-methyltransferase